MTSKQEDKNELRGHSFDGIQEYNNDLPRWWVRLFYATIVFSVPYFIWYHTPFFNSKSLVDEYMDSIEQQVKTATAAADASAPIDYSSPELIEKGRAVFSTNCAACHGATGHGVIGPNLADDHWIHGATLADVTNIIDKGVPAKGMPAWGSVLGAEKIAQTVAFIKSIQGTSGSNPKPAQGTQGTLK